MASLTPGVLLKLLQSMNSPSDPKVAGEHRSAVLQVIGIVPALTASTADSLWPSHGFFLQLSDSLHSTFVSLSDRDADAVLSTRPQLGQLVHVDRLHFAHPLPLASGLRPVAGPGGRPQPFVGNPEPLVARTSPSHRGFVIQPAPPGDTGPPLISSKKPNSSPVDEKRTVFAPKENVVIKNSGELPTMKRRFSSPSAGKLASRKTSAESRDPSPTVGATRAGSRSSSPVPSKCVVPSLVAAKDENRRSAKEPAIVVPSRYRQPSPVGRKAAASPMGRRGSMSPGRRLSVGLKVSPATGEGVVGGKKKVGLVVAGISRVSDALMGSAKSVRKSWDDSSMSSVLSLELKEKGGAKSKLNKEAILKTQVAISGRLSDAAREQSNTEEASSNEKPKQSKKIESISSEKPNLTPTKITVHDRKWTDGSVPLDSVSDNLAKLGKDALQRRDIASIAAAEALEEALITESVIRNLSLFSDLCSSSKAVNPLPTIDRFLSIYNDVLKHNTVAESLIANRNTNSPSEATTITSLTTSASVWVEAALATDLEVLQLLNNSSEFLHKQKVTDKQAIAPVDPPRKSVAKRQSFGTPAKNHSKVSPSLITNTWNKGHGVSETLDLARALRHEMQIWFLKFVEEALVMGFRMFGESASGREASCNDNGKVAAVLSQLKRINDWLDGVGRLPEEETTKEKIEQLKRKIYGFVISHMGSAFESSVSLSKS
ncbi:uncharacterized protein [Typha latifolia]|uniref:uncharacterized protein n=1 Tax=Typha latifolia TaxID=4733 RepID=UPI003C2D4D22